MCCLDHEKPDADGMSCPKINILNRLNPSCCRLSKLLSLLQFCWSGFSPEPGEPLQNLKSYHRTQWAGRRSVRGRLLRYSMVRCRMASVCLVMLLGSPHKSRKTQRGQGEVCSFRLKKYIYRPESFRLRRCGGHTGRQDIISILGAVGRYEPLSNATSKI